MHFEVLFNKIAASIFLIKVWYGGWKSWLISFLIESFGKQNWRCKMYGLGVMLNMTTPKVQLTMHNRIDVFYILVSNKAARTQYISWVNFKPSMKPFKMSRILELFYRYLIFSEFFKSQNIIQEFKNSNGNFCSFDSQGSKSLWLIVV